MGLGEIQLLFAHFILYFLRWMFSLSTLYLQELIMSTFPAFGGYYCLNHILQLWGFYLFVLANLHFHFTLVEGCSNIIFYSVIPLRFFAEEPVFKQNSTTQSLSSVYLT